MSSDGWSRLPEVAEIEELNNQLKTKNTMENETCNTTKPATSGEPMLGDVNGGVSLIGKSIEIWINGKYGRFFRTGKIIDYKKNKSKGKGKLSITKGLYLIDLGNIKLWRTRSDFNIA